MIRFVVVSLSLVLGFASADFACYSGECGLYTCTSGVGFYCCGICDCCIDVVGAWWFWVVLVSQWIV